MNKKAKMGVVATSLTVLVIVALFGGLIWFLSAQGVFQSFGGDGGLTKSGDCQISPSVNLLAKNTLVTGTTPSISANYTIYDGSYVGSVPTSLAYGKSLDVLATATNYLNAESKLSALKCGANNDMSFDFVPYQIATYTVLDYTTTQLSDGTTGGTHNETASANAITETLRIVGAPDKSTGDMLVTIDFSNKTQVTSGKITMAGAKRVNNPTWFTPAGTGSAVASFLIPAIVDGGVKTYEVTFSPETGQTIGSPESTVLTTIYALNPVILDTQTGTFQTENTWEDSLGADKTIANVDYDFIIT